MDKNIVALIREDTKTVKVKFFPDVKLDSDNPLYNKCVRKIAGKEYTYVTTLDCKPCDLALVFVEDRPAIVEIQSVDAELSIQPSEEVKYEYLVAIVDTEPYEKLKEQNEKLEDIVRNEYQKNIRQQFRNLFLTSSSADTLKLLDEVLK